jgi:hypothetical protein
VPQAPSRIEQQIASAPNLSNQMPLLSLKPLIRLLVLEFRANRKLREPFSVTWNLPLQNQDELARAPGFLRPIETRRQKTPQTLRLRRYGFGRSVMKQRSCAASPLPLLAA